MTPREHALAKLIINTGFAIPAAVNHERFAAHADDAAARFPYENRKTISLTYTATYTEIPIEPEGPRTTPDFWKRSGNPFAEPAGERPGLTYVTRQLKVTYMEKTQVYLRKEELDALREAAARSGRSVAELVRDAIRKVVLKPRTAGPVAIWDGEPRRTSIEHDSVHDEP